MSYQGKWDQHTCSAVLNEKNILNLHSLNGFLKGSPNDSHSSVSYSNSNTLVTSFPYLSNNFWAIGFKFVFCLGFARR